VFAVDWLLLRDRWCSRPARLLLRRRQLGCRSRSGYWTCPMSRIRFLVWRPMAVYM